MGGGNMNAPKDLWSPSGGFYPDPKYWRRNTVIALAGIALTAGLIFSKTKNMEQRWGAPAFPIPSQKWTPAANWHSK